MNQAKIGAFIAQKRTDKHLTQSELGERLGVTDRAISNWENGKNMPDLSLFKPLCEILDVTINELLSGEEIKEIEYQEKFEENIIDMVNDVSKKEKKKRYKLITLIIILPLLCFFIYYVIGNIEMNVKYDESVMNCHFENNNLIYEIKGISVINTSYIETEFNEEKIYFFRSKINLTNKIRSHWETWDSMSKLLNQEELSFGSTYQLKISASDKVKVYHTDIPLTKIKKANNKELQNLINKSQFMCTNY